MSSNLIAVTPRIQVQPLAFKGIMVYASFPQIRDMLLHKFGDEFVLLFARPVENAQAGQIDWYTPVQGAAARLAAMPEADRPPVYDHIQRMGSQIKDYAEELINSGDPLKSTRGHILKLALVYPDDQSIYVVGQQPVLTCWGCQPGTPGVQGKTIARMFAATPLPSGPATQRTPAPPIAKRAFPWLWCLLPLLLLFLLLFASFGALPALSGYTLLHLPLDGLISDTGKYRQQIVLLDERIDKLRGDLARHAALCSQQAPQPEPQQEAKPPNRMEELVIPENAPDTSFLEGDWLCETGLANARTREAVEVRITFDRNGHGRAAVYEKNDRCEGKALASLQNGLLEVAINGLSCAKSGSRYGKMLVECKNSHGAAVCSGRNADGTFWGATFLRQGH